MGKDKRGPRPKRAVGLDETTVVELTKVFKGRLFEIPWSHL